MTEQDQPDSVIPEPVCFVDTCPDKATYIFWNKPLCSYHYEISKH